MRTEQNMRSEPSNNQGRAVAQSPSKNMGMPFENLGAIDEMIIDEDEDSPRSENLVNRDVTSQLRREADQSDSNVDRYLGLVQQGMNIVSEVKSALYDADDSGQDAGAEVLLDEVRDMLENITQTTLAEAVQLQKTSESWLGMRRKMVRQLKINHDALQMAIQRRVETARESNAENRADCDRLWRQIQDLEKEVDSLPRLQKQGSILQGTNPLSPTSDAASTFSAPASGLTLEGAHSLLRAFNAVLRPHMSEIIPPRAEERSSSEAIAQEFLNACNESAKQVSQNPSANSKSPPPPMATMPRCNSSPSVIHGDQVETTKPDGLLPLNMVKEEQRMLFSKVGQSY